MTTGALMAFVGLVFTVVYCLSVVLVGYVVYSPLRPRFQRTPSKQRGVEAIDLLSTLIPISIGFAAMQWWIPHSRRDALTVMLVMSSVIAGVALVSLYGMRLQWRMSLGKWWKRLLLLGILMPFGMAISVVAFPLIVLSRSLQTLLIRILCGLLCIALLRFFANFLSGSDDSIHPVATPIRGHSGTDE